MKDLFITSLVNIRRQGVVALIMGIVFCSGTVFLADAAEQVTDGSVQIEATEAAPAADVMAEKAPLETVVSAVPADLAVKQVSQPVLSEPFKQYKDLPPEEFAVRSWESLAARDFDALNEYAGACSYFFGEQAQQEQSLLRTYPTMGREDDYAVLNSVGTCHYVLGEAAMVQEDWARARDEFILLLEKYSFSQCWDPRGWYWKIAEKSIINLNKIAAISPATSIPSEYIQKRSSAEDKDKTKEEMFSEEPVIVPALTLHEPGSSGVIDYTAYGVFEGIGTKNFSYRLKNRKGLSAAVGEGIYPNTQGVLKDPGYVRLKKAGQLDGSHWDYVRSDNPAIDFYKWALAPEEKGVRQFYTSIALEQAGFIRHAIRSYYSILVHFPRSIGWTYWHTPWYVAQAAIDRIDFLIRTHPELGLTLEDARVKVINGYDNSIANDVFEVNPGKLKKLSLVERVKKYVQSLIPRAWKLDKLQVAEQRVSGRVSLDKLENGHWMLKVDGKPFFMRAVAYSCSKIGQSPDEGSLQDWMTADINNNGKMDGPYDSWVDKNHNNERDPDENVVGDFELLRQMNCNTLRVYHHAANKELLQDLYENYGIMILMGDLLGAYAVGSGASWYRGTDYTNPEHQANMLAGVKEMVMEHKDEPYILMWVLGNENNYGVANNAKKNPRAYYKFVNEVAKWIKSVDPDHPVAVCSGDLLFLDIFAEECPDVDVYGANAYRGDHGFGRSFWQNILETCDKPAIITEYGCPAYKEGVDREMAEEAQAQYLRGCLGDLEYNAAGGGGLGNSLGGVLFEWMDEWWKAYEPMLHDTTHLFSGPFPDGYMHEEWLGLVSQGDGSDSPFMRQLRKSYFLCKELWSKQWP